MKISVALATYNGALYLREQLDSLVNQTMRPHELIVSDDCSTDNTVSILNDFKINAPFNVLILQNTHNLGFACNFEKAIEQCNGDVIFLCDQDDYWYPEKISSIVRLFDENSKISVVLNDARICNSEMNVSAGTLIESMTHDGFMHGCCMSFRADLKEILLPIPCKAYTHDHWISLFGRGLSTMLISPLVLQNYRRHQSTVTNSQSVNSEFILAPKKYLKKITDMNMFFVNPSDACKERVLMLNTIKNRLIEKRKNIIKIFGNHIALDAYIEDLNSLIEQNNLRLTLLGMRFPEKIFSVISNYRSGLYANFGGVKSALKDVLFHMAKNE